MLLFSILCCPTTIIIIILKLTLLGQGLITQYHNQRSFIPVSLDTCAPELPVSTLSMSRQTELQVSNFLETQTEPGNAIYLSLNKINKLN